MKFTIQILPYKDLAELKAKTNELRSFLKLLKLHPYSIGNKPNDSFYCILSDGIKEDEHVRLQNALASYLQLKNYPFQMTLLVSFD